MGAAGAPVIEWIRAIENPDADNSTGYTRFKDWERQTDTGQTLAFGTPPALLNFRAYEDLADGSYYAVHLLWHPDADEFRGTEYADKAIRESGLLKYWQARGFPPHCKPVGADGYECGRPGGQ